jgi:hypothetical protein
MFMVGWIKGIFHTAVLSRVFAKVNAIPPQMMSELTCRDVRFWKLGKLGNHFIKHVLNELDLVRYFRTT